MKSQKQARKCTNDATRTTLLIQGARENNLRNITVEFPRNKLVVVTGVSGSGKSSLAFDTLYAEGQRRLLASMSAYAKRFVNQLRKPDVDFVHGLSPVRPNNNIPLKLRSNPTTTSVISETSDFFYSPSHPQFPTPYISGSPLTARIHPRVANSGPPFCNFQAAFLNPKRHLLLEGLI